MPPTVAAALFSLLLGSPVWADEDEKEKRQNFTVTSWAYKRLSEAHEHIGKGKYNAAIEVVKDMLDRQRRLNDHEKSLMWQTFGYIYTAKEQFPKAIRAFEQCLAVGAMPKGALLDTTFNLGQLYLMNNQYRKAIQTLRAWLSRVENPRPDSKYMLAMAYVQVKDYKNALVWGKQAVGAMRKPKESWLQLLLSCHIELKQLKQAAGVLSRLVGQYPKRTYWLQLAAVYGELKQEKRATAVLELAYMQNYLKNESELNNLHSLYMHLGIPLKAAKVLEQGIKNGIIKRTAKSLRSLADALLQARELKRALEPLSSAAQLSANGDLYVRLATVRMQREEWAKAAKALQSAVGKGKLTDPGNAHLYMGIAHFNADKISSACKAFGQALGFANTKKSAQQWIRSLKGKCR